MDKVYVQMSAMGRKRTSDPAIDQEQPSAASLTTFATELSRLQNRADARLGPC